ncbi:MAG: FTR1 family iron permease [Methylobacteriaceae bacterium]|jgi:high-affinity iron transporter|nr:FTR1 family iron permease [Methylobacteriaceae bacterium]
MIKVLLHLLLLCCVVTSLRAEPGIYETFIRDIEHRLDATAVAYREHRVEDAKTAVQMAYFEVFENLEGPIRINISAKKSAELEAVFGEIRKMIIAGKPQSEVEARIVWLKTQIRATQSRIEGGHALRAEGAHGVYENDAVHPFWSDSFRLMDDALADAITLYRQNRFDDARAAGQRARFEGFKNPEMEIALRSHRSAAATEVLNQRFTTLQTLAGQPGNITRLGYAVTTLLQDIEEQLEGVPPPQSALSAAPVETEEDTSADWNRVADDINIAIAAAIERYRAGHTAEAVAAVQNAYFDHFEASGMENRLGARDNTFKTTVEGYFTTLSGLMSAQRPVEDLNVQARNLADDLAKTAALLGQGSGQTLWDSALMSFTIIFREGLEALLIVAAIAGYLVKNNHGDKFYLVRQSVGVALLASVVTAVAFFALFSNAGAQRELLEGFTMLFAVVVLFSVSYWLLSKAEADKWQAYLHRKLEDSLSRGSMIGLWFTCFLAVYREGAETVLFYQALIADSRGLQQTVAIPSGFVAGCVLLGIVYWIIRHSIVRLPLKPFFMLTGLFMYLMAFAFAGKGMLELIEGRLFQPTLLPLVPDIPLLGIHPYVETVIPQMILLIAAVVAGCVLLRRRPGEVVPVPA